MSRRTLSLAAVLLGLTGLAGSAFAQSGPLLQPGEPYPGTTEEPLHLHLPAHKPAAAKPASPPSGKETSSAAINEEAGESAPQVDLIHPPRHKSAARVANMATQPSAQESIPFSLDGNSAMSPPTAGTPAGPAGTKARPATGAVRQASLEGAAPAEHNNMTKRGAVLFDRGAPAPSPAQYKGLKVLADALNTALEKGASGIQLEAYGGNPGDKSSDARRLSLRRALSVRQLLIDDGVPSARIDVRAMGGAEDKGPTDRVDVFVRAG